LSLLFCLEYQSRSSVLFSQRRSQDKLASAGGNGDRRTCHIEHPVPVTQPLDTALGTRIPIQPKTAKYH
jgi:hypothetical protein